MKTGSLLSALILAAAASAQAATITYTNNFSGTGANTAFTTENADANWALGSGAYQFSFTSTAVAASSANLAITNASATSFVMESKFTITSFGLFNNNGTTIGFGLFGADTAFSGSAGSPYYLADWTVANSASTNVGKLRILSLTDPAGFTAVDSTADDNALSTQAATANTTYTLRLTGTYSSGTLNLSLGIFNSSGLTQIGSSATAVDTSPLTGTAFGYRNRVGIGGGSFNTSFDDFSITAVPEPATWAMLCGGLFVLGAVAYRRRQQAAA